MKVIDDHVGISVGRQRLIFVTPAAKALLAHLTGRVAQLPITRRERNMVEKI